MKVLAEAPGKLILLGEYAVLEGAPALVAAVNRFARVMLSPAHSDSFSVEAPVIDVPAQRFRLNEGGRIEFVQKPLAKLKFFVSIFEYAVRILREKNIPVHPVQITLDTSEFFLRKGAAKLGLGSSAALTVALLAGLFEYYGGPDGLKQNDYDLFRIALSAHKKAQGNVGSGIDVAACVFGGMIQYQLSEAGQEHPARIAPVHIPPDLLFLPIWSGKPSSTSQLVNQFYGYKKKNGNGYQKLLDQLRELAERGSLAFRSGDTAAFLQSVRAYYERMFVVGNTMESPIISPEHQKIADVVYQAGGYYKPSGAGGGDLGIAFVRSAREFTQLASLVQKSGFDVVHLEMGAPGVTINRMN